MLTTHNVDPSRMLSPKLMGCSKEEFSETFLSLTLVFRGRFYKHNMHRYANSYDKQYNPDNQSLNRENDGTGNRYPQQKDGGNLYFPRHASSVQVIAHVGAKKSVA